MRTWITRVLYSFGVGVLCTQLQAQTLNEAKKLYNEGQYAEAKPVFEKLVKQSPSNSSYNLWYGACCFETGEMDKAEKYLSFAVKRRQIEAFRYMIPGAKKAGHRAGRTSPGFIGRCAAHDGACGECADYR